jgi:hypothetical protein
MPIVKMPATPLADDRPRLGPAFVDTVRGSGPIPSPVGLDNPVVLLFRTATAAHARLPDDLLGSGFLHRIDVPGANLYLTPNRAYNDPAPEWWWSAALPLPRVAR